MLFILKYSFGNDAISYVKILRLFSKLPLLCKEQESEIKEKIQSIMGTVMLPALGMFESNPNVVAEFWAIYGTYDFKIRYYHYRSWFDLKETESPE